MTELVLHCSWRTCRQPADWRITAGHPGTGQYYSGGTCEQHRHHIERRAKQASCYAPTRAERIDRPPDPEDVDAQTALDI